MFFLPPDRSAELLIACSLAGYAAQVPFLFFDLHNSRNKDFFGMHPYRPPVPFVSQKNEILSTVISKFSPWEEKIF